jgi:hypothetical protein
MCVALVAGQESGAHDDSLGASSDRGTRRRRIADPARGKQRQRHGPSHLGQQRQQTHDALHMAASLNTLHDQRVGARICRRSSRVRRADLYQDSCAAGARAGNQLRTKSEGERHDRYALLDSHLKALVLLEVEHEVHAKRAVRHARDRADLLAQDLRLGPRRTQRPEASRLRHLVSESRGSAPAQGRLHDGNVQAHRAHDTSLPAVKGTRSGPLSSTPTG